jgi:dihydropteroate synthase
MQAHYVVEITDQAEARKLLQQMGVSSYGVEYMASKAVFRCVKLKHISALTANLIKQEMLSKGGEAGVAMNTASGQGFTDVLLMGTLRHYQLLMEKLKLQPFGLAALADQIKEVLDAQETCVRQLQLAHGRRLEFGKKTLVMGILNVTPDSFSDGGRYYNTEDALRHAMEMCEQGADIIDIGGASSRPNSKMAEEQEELCRVVPVIERLAREGIIMSVDTFRAKVAEKALERGAHFINDISNLQMDEDLLPVLIAAGSPVVLMHNRMQIHQDEPYTDLIADIIGDLKKSIDRALAAGLQAEKIILDPGVGFGKTPGENRMILKSLRSFKSCGYPLLLGTSRKSFIGQTLNLEVEERLEASLATVAIGIMNGADIVRVHDVKESKRVALMTDAVIRENG